MRTEGTLAKWNDDRGFGIIRDRPRFSLAHVENHGLSPVTPVISRSNQKKNQQWKNLFYAGFALDDYTSQPRPATPI